MVCGPTGQTGHPAVLSASNIEGGLVQILLLAKEEDIVLEMTCRVAIALEASAKV